MSSPCDIPESLSFGSAIVPLDAVDLVVMPSVDVAALQAQDLLLALSAIPTGRIGKNLKADLSPSTAGTGRRSPTEANCGA